MCCIAIPNYCDPTVGFPSVANANTPTPYTTVGSTTYYTCALGYQSSGGATNPSVTCNNNTSTSGLWSTTINTCQGIDILQVSVISIDRFIIHAFNE